MEVKNKYGHATTIINNRSKRTGMLLAKWNYVGPENNWQPTQMYHVLMSLGRYKYIIEEDLTRLYTEVEIK